MHTRKVPLTDDVDLSVIARGTPGFSGADLANLVNEAALWAARQSRKLVMMADFEMSKDKVLMGVERKSMILSEEEKRNTAYHEAGHALVAAMTPGTDPLHKVTIIPRGMALGLTMQLPIDDKHTYTKTYLEGTLTVLMGGRCAEEIFLGHITTGAGNDIERATDIARKMVCDWGMSELGPLAFGKKEEAIFLGREIAQHRDYSEDTAIHIDQEVHAHRDRRLQQRAQHSREQPRHPRAHRARAARPRSSRRDGTEAAHGQQAAAGEGAPRAAFAAAASPRRRAQASAASGAASRPRLQQGLKSSTCNVWICLNLRIFAIVQI